MRMVCLIIGLVSSFYSSAQLLDDFYQLNSYNEVLCLEADESSLWAGTTRGLVQRDKKTGELCAIWNNSNSPLPTDSIYMVYKDSLGNLWAGSTINLCKFDGMVWEVILEGATTSFGFVDDLPVRSFWNEMHTVFESFYQIDHDTLDWTYYIDPFHNTWKLERKWQCGGGGGGSFGCGIQHFGVSRYADGQWNQILTKTMNFGSFGFGPDGNILYFSEGYLIHFDIENLQAIDSIPYTSLYGPPQIIINDYDDFYCAGNIVSHYNGSAFENIEPYHSSSVYSKSVTEVDTSGNIFTGTTKSGTFKYENDQWTNWVEGLLSNTCSIIENEIGPTVFTHTNGVSILENEHISPYNEYNSPIPNAELNGFIDGVGDTWLYHHEVDSNVYRYTNNAWVVYELAPNTILSNEITDHYHDEMGNTWFVYSDTVANQVVSKFDGTNWSSYSTLDSLYLSPAFPSVYWFVDDISIKKREGLSVSSYPIPAAYMDCPEFLTGAVSQNGVGAIVTKKYCSGSILNYQLFKFDGNNWAFIDEDVFYQLESFQIHSDGTIWYLETVPPYSSTPIIPRLSKISINNTVTTQNILAPSQVSNFIYALHHSTNYKIMEDGTIWGSTKLVVGNGWPGWGTTNYERRDFVFRITNGQTIIRDFSYTQSYGQWAIDYGAVFLPLNNSQNNIWLGGKNLSLRPILPQLETYGKSSDCKSYGLACVTSGGQAPFNFQWDNGDTNPLQSGIGDGVHEVSVTDSEQAGNTDSLNLVGPNTFLFNPILSLPTSPSNNDGQIATNVSGANPPYTFEWSTGATTSNIDSLTQGIYSLTVTDSDDCSKVESYQLSEDLFVSYISNESSCFQTEDGTINLSISGGIQPYDILWSTGDNTSDLTNLSPGNYVATVSDSGILFDVIFITIESPDVIAANFSYSIDTSSQSANVMCTPEGGTAPYTYLWNTGATISFLENQPYGSYALTISDANGCTTTDDIVLAPVLTTAIEITENLCHDENGINISANINGGVPPYQIMWSSGETTPDIISPGGVLQVTVTDALNTVSYGSVNASQPYPINLSGNVINLDEVNETGDIAVNANGGGQPYEYLWSNGATTQDLQDVPFGDYSLTVTNVDGCTKSILFYVYPPFLFFDVSTGNPVCPDENYNVALVEISYSNVAPPYQYEWDGNSVFSNDTFLIIENLSPGIHSITVSGFFGGSYTTTFEITDILPLDFNVFVDQDISGGTVDITSSLSGGTAPYEYLWSNGSTSANLDDVPFGDYSLAYTDSNGCTDTIFFSIPFEINFSFTNVLCYGANDGTAFIEITNGDLQSPYTFEWDGNSTVTDNPFISLTGLEPGIYDVFVTDSSGVGSILSFEIIGPDPFSVDFSIDQNTITALAIGGTPPYQYLWGTGDTTATIINLTSGEYGVSVTDSCGASYITSTSITSASDLSAGLKYSIYPNPTNSMVHIKSNEQQQLAKQTMVYNGIGKSINIPVEKISPTHLTLDFSNSPSGVYLIVFQKGSELFSERIIIAH